MNENKYKNLWAKDKDDYGPEYNSHLLDLFKFFTESAEKISDKRAKANNFYMSANTLLISIAGILLPRLEGFEIYILVTFFITGIILCISWIGSISTYSSYNSAKFEIINEVEKKLPFKPYEFEWHLLSSKKTPTFSTIEKKIPKIFIAIHATNIVLIFVYFFLKDGI